MTRVIVNGVGLNVEQIDHDPGHPTVVWLHGFTGAADNWLPHMHALRDRCSSIAIDALGHGTSDAPREAARYGMPHVVADTLALLDHLKVDRFVLVGYSMGGRMALHIALAATRRLAGLVLESASPGLESAIEREQRMEADADLAMLLEHEGIAAFVDRWERAPLWDSQVRLPATTLNLQRRQRLRSNPLGLAGSLRGVGIGTQQPLHARLGELATPTLLIAGEQDSKFAALARSIHGSLPQSRLAIIPGAGHNVHLEAPDRFDTVVKAFLDDILETGPIVP